ncbi:MAG TPA: biotin/lipoyl-containing protein [Candidatus Limnocylindrales bacterium]|nr:biotin/lipoyl-containing protein [Candidatus Limnocylindrales bacterium]
MTEELERPMDLPDADDDVAPAPIVPGNAGDASLLGLIDRLGNLLERSDLTELEVEVGGTALVLRKPAAIGSTLATSVAIADPTAAPATAAVPAATPAAAAEGPAAPSRPAIAAPLTGIWYASPAPGSAPFVDVGREVAVGQVVGLIEAMKLFNEIKSDLAGRVVRVVPESGSLVKAKQPLIEVEPL